MAISYYSGKPGSGKSYFVVERVIVPALQSGRTVVTNIPMTEEALSLGGNLIQFSRGKNTMSDIADMLLGDVSEETGEFAPNPECAGAVFVLDEFSFLMPAGQKQNLIPDKIKAFFSMHRHISGGGFSTEIIVISQSANQINIYVKDMIEQSYRIEKTMLGKKALVNLSIYSGCVGYRGGAGRAELLKKETTKYNPDTFKYYKSQTMDDELGQGLEVRTDDATNILKSPALKMILGAFLLFPVMVFFAWNSFSSLFSDSEELVSSVPESVSFDSPAPDLRVNDLNIASSPVDSISSARSVLADDSFSDRSIPLAPLVDNSWGEGLKLWYLGSYQKEGEPVDHILMVQSWQGNPQRVYASDLAEVGVVVERKRGGFMVAYLDGIPFMLPRYPDKVKRDKAFFSSGGLLG